MYRCADVQGWSPASRPAQWWTQDVWGAKQIKQGHQLHVELYWTVSMCSHTWPGKLGLSLINHLEAHEGELFFQPYGEANHVSSILRAHVSEKAPERAPHFLLSPQEGALPEGASSCFSHSRLVCWKFLRSLSGTLGHCRGPFVIFDALQRHVGAQDGYSAPRNSSLTWSLTLLQETVHSGRCGPMNQEPDIVMNSLGRAT